MYFFDPQLGKQRRKKFKDKFNSTLSDTRKDAEAKLRDIRNRAYGTYREISSSLLEHDEGAGSQSPNRTEEPASKS
jgi:hypothetical protein